MGGPCSSCIHLLLCGFLSASALCWPSKCVERPTRISNPFAVASQWDEKTFSFCFACDWAAPERRNLLYWKVFLSTTGAWNWMIFMAPSKPNHSMVLWRKTVNVTCSLWEWVCHGVWRAEGWGTSTQRICPHLKHKREALWKIQSKREKWPAHCLHTFSWGATATESFYQILGKQDITEITFLNPHLLIGIIMGYDSGLWENVHLLIMRFKWGHWCRILKWF